MSDIEIVHQHTRGFSETGQVSERSESFIKILTSFRRGTLRHLKGAPLSVYMCIALHEADEQPGCSLTEMERETGYTRPTVCAAVQFLSDGASRFIEEAGLESDGTKRYRVTRFAWFGQKPKPQEANPDPQTASKKILPPRASKNFLLAHDDMNDVQNEKHFETSCIHDVSATKKILSAANIQGKNLDLLAARVSPETAQLWAEWLENVDRTAWKRPEGFLFNQLTADPCKRPPYAKPANVAPEQTASKRPIIRGKLAAMFESEDEA